MKSDGTTGVTPKNEKTNDFMKKMLSAITKTSQKPKVPAVSPFQKKKPSILVNGDGIHAHKVMSVTQIKTDLKKVLDKNDQKKLPDLKMSEKGKENTIQKQNVKEETKINAKETTSKEANSEGLKESLATSGAQNKKQAEPVVASTPTATQMVTKSSPTLQKENKENETKPKSEPTPQTSQSSQPSTHSSTVPLTTPVSSTDSSIPSDDKAVTLPANLETKAPVGGTPTTLAPPTKVPSSSTVAATSTTSSKTTANQPQPKKQTPIEKVKQLLAVRAKVKKQPITEPTKPKTLIGSSEIEHVLKAVKLPETNSETQPVPSSSSNQNQLLSTQKETKIKNEDTPKSDENPTLKARNTSSSSLEPCLLDPVPPKEVPATKEAPSKELIPPTPEKTPTSDAPSNKTAPVALVVPPMEPSPIVPPGEVSQKVAEKVAKPSLPSTENKLEETKMIPDISSTTKQDSNPDNKTVETSPLIDSQSTATISVAPEKITDEKSDPSVPSKACSVQDASKITISKEIPTEKEIPPAAKPVEETKTSSKATEKAPTPVPDSVVPPVDTPIQLLPSTSTGVSATPSSIEQKKPEVINKPPNKAIVNLISSEMAPGSPGADSEDDLPLDVIVIKKSSKEPEPKKEPTPVPPAAPTTAPPTESILTVNPVEAPIGQPTPTMGMFDQPTGSVVPPIVPESAEPNTPTANPLDLVFGPDGDDNIFDNATDDPSALLPDIFGPTSTPPLPAVTSHSLPGTVRFTAIAFYRISYTGV